MLFADGAVTKTLVHKIFKYYDRNGDESLSLSELSYSQNADHLEKLAHICSLKNLLIFGQNTDLSKPIDLVTFYREFGAYLSYTLSALDGLDGSQLKSFVRQSSVFDFELKTCQWRNSGHDIQQCCSFASFIRNLLLVINIIFLLQSIFK